ncbi:hypothetical protein IEZ26_04610 [Nocardioides cavernae]|uniref:Uncharacterized protein n=1 Tax=Nocardioides cavernae TaxID=1921566 RepID=A0ABR8NAL0_9ACTN|nr:hypothetical protein [Nocardioides cavernae]MBD3923894.1 hypothetical protein [Nocardioides cavernae]MBM7511170.1 hypothetical protein [Nocardioides cavernae]
MNDSQLPPAPATPPAEPAPAYAPTAPARRTWRDRLPRRFPSGRRAVAAGAVVAGLAIGGAGFGAGYAVGDDGSADTATTQTTDGWGDRQPPGGDRGPMGEMGGPPGDLTQGEGGTTDQAPDFDGDGQPDTDSDTDSGSSDSTAQNS